MFFRKTGCFINGCLPVAVRRPKIVVLMEDMFDLSLGLVLLPLMDGRRVQTIFKSPLGLLVWLACTTAKPT